VWQSVQAKIPWALAACFVGSIEMLLPLPEVIPGWPCQARQLSSCLRGWGAFACAGARACAGAPPEKRGPARKSKTKMTGPNRPAAVFAVYAIFFRKPRLQLKLCFILFNHEGFAEEVP
jgi:hypothetical protein